MVAEKDILGMIDHPFVLSLNGTRPLAHPPTLTHPPIRPALTAPTTCRGIYSPLVCAGTYHNETHIYMLVDAAMGGELLRLLQARTCLMRQVGAIHLPN